MCVPAASSSARISVRIASTSGTTMIGPVALDRLAKPVAVEHGEDLGLVGDLHGGRAGIGIAGDHIGAEPLGGDGELLAELARAEQQDPRR